MIKHIIHISDIHNRLYKRHAEYREVFAQLVKQIRDFSFEFSEALIVVTGDVAHSKTDMSPESVDLTAELFNMLGELHKTIVILGNHDLNLKNPNRLDSLSPILEAMDHPNIILLNDSSLVYYHENLAFSLFSMVDGSHVPAQDIDKSFIKIALFHGIVSGTKNTFGYTFDDNHSDVKVNVFKGFDMVLLGDIHTPQKVSDNPEARYAGSLISQDFSEEYPHGFLLWNTEDKTATFHEVPNDFGYYTVNIKDGKITTDISKLSKKPRIRFMLENTTYERYKEILKELRKTHEIREAYQIIDTPDKRKNRNISLFDVRDPSKQDKLIEEYLKQEHPQITKEQLSEVFKINAQTNKNIGFANVRRGIVWKPKRFEFSNMFSYAEDNVIDFEKMDGILGLFAPNAMGKTSILDSLLFCIFDKCTRAFKASNIMNVNKNEFECLFNFEVDSQDFWIHRRANRQKGGNVRVEVDFWMIDDANEKVMLNSDTRRSTNEIIRGYIGEYEDFVLTALSSQINTVSFIDKSQSEKKDLLAQFLDVGVFDALYNEAMEEVKDVKAVLTQFQQQDLTEHQSNLEKQIEEKKWLIESGKKDQEKFEKIVENLIHEKADKKSQIVETKVVAIDKQALTNKSNDYNERGMFAEEEARNISDELKSLQDSAIDLVEKRKKLNRPDIEDKYEIYLSLVKDMREVELKIDRNKSQLHLCEEKLKIYEDDDYNSECDACNRREQRDRPEALKLRDKLRELKIEQSELQIDWDTTEGALNEFDSIANDYEELKQVKFDISSLQVKVLSLQTKERKLLEEANTYFKNVEEIEKTIQEYEDNKDIAERNKKLEEEIREIESDIRITQKDVSDIRNENYTNSIALGMLENNLNLLKDTIEKAAQYEKKYEAYKYYLEATSRDGVQYSLISQIVPELEREINEILSQLVDFSISIELDGKDVNSYINKGTSQWPLEMTSGMERFICTLAFRTGLINISNLPRPNFLAIDEGFGVMDAENIASVNKLFEYMRNQFDFVLVVSHIENMKDMVDESIDITNDGTFSTVEFE